MSLLLKNNKEATELMLSMRTLINQEFKVLLNFTQDEIEEQLCIYGFKSHSPELLAKAKQLANIIAAPVSDKPININNLLELLASNQLNEPSHIVATGVPALVVDKKSYKCWFASTLSRLVKLGEIDVSSIEVRLLSDGERMDLVDYLRLSQPGTEKIIPMHSLPLDEFFWFASTNFSHGKLLQKVSLMKRIRLTRWPEVCRQREYKTYTRMAIQLMRYSASVSELNQARESLSKENVILFLNACYLCGWLVETQEPLEVKQDDPGKKNRLNFISRIRAKLGIGRSRAL